MYHDVVELKVSLSGFHKEYFIFLLKVNLQIMSKL